MKNLLKITSFVFIICGAYLYLGKMVRDISGEEQKVAVVGINPEAGKAIFWGKGKCSTCHSVGEEGSAIRCPNLGVNSKFPLPIGARAVERAAEISKKRGIPFTATDYLVESIASPDAYVVEGFKNEMPFVYKAPISLSPDEVKAVITYMQGLGGEVNIVAIKLPDIIKQAEAEGGEVAAKETKPYMEGDLAEGEELFFNLESNAACAKCHKVKGKGGNVGPDLSNVAGTRSKEFIIESILFPNKEMASGYEPTLIVTKDGKFITGIIKEEDAQSVKLMDNQGNLITVGKESIAKNVPQKTSIMPGNFSDVLTIKEFHSVFAFLQTLK